MNRFITTTILTVFLLATTVACAHNDSYMHYSEHSRNSSFSITLHEGRGHYDHGYRSRNYGRYYDRHRGSRYDRPKRLGHYRTTYQQIRGMPDFFQKQYYESPGHCIVKTAERVRGYTYRVTFYRRPHC